MPKTVLWFIILHDLVLTALWIKGVNIVPVFIYGLVVFVLLLILELKLMENKKC